MAAPDDPLPRYLAALEARHLAELRFAEVRRALRALSSLYVERRERLRQGAALEGAGKRAAFALYYGPLHFLLVREIVRALGSSLPPVRRILDLGCGTGAAGAAWALAQTPAAAIEGVDTSGWALEEARFTFRQLGLSGTVRRGDASAFPPAKPPCGILAAFTVNELTAPARERLLQRLREAAAAGTRLLVIEPIARSINPWWPEWSRTFRDAGGREDEWRFRSTLPPPLALLAKAAGLDLRQLQARSLCLTRHPSPAADPAHRPLPT